MTKIEGKNAKLEFVASDGKIQQVGDAVMDIKLATDNWQAALKELNTNFDKWTAVGLHKPLENPDFIDWQWESASHHIGPITQFPCEASIRVYGNDHTTLEYTTHHVDFSKNSNVTLGLSEIESKNCNWPLNVKQSDILISYGGVDRYFTVNKLELNTVDYFALTLHVNDTVGGELYDFLKNDKLVQHGVDVCLPKHNESAFSNLFTNQPIAAVSVTNKSINSDADPGIKPNLLSLSIAKRQQIISDAIEFPYEAPDAWFAGHTEQGVNTPDYETVSARAIIGALLECGKLDTKLNDTQRKELVAGIRQLLIDSEKAYVHMLADIECEVHLA